MEYHKTKDILHVQEKLGHRDIESTLIYTHLVGFEGGRIPREDCENLQRRPGTVEVLI